MELEMWTFLTNVYKFLKIIVNMVEVEAISDDLNGTFAPKAPHEKHSCVIWCDWKEPHLEK